MKPILFGMGAGLGVFLAACLIVGTRLFDNLKIDFGGY